MNGKLSAPVCTSIALCIATVCTALPACMWGSSLTLALPQQHSIMHEAKEAKSLLTLSSQWQGMSGWQLLLLQLFQL